MPFPSLPIQASLSAHPLAHTPCNFYRVVATIHKLLLILPGGSHEKEGLRAHINKLTLTLQNHVGIPSVMEDVVDEPDDAVSY